MGRSNGEMLTWWNIHDIHVTLLHLELFLRVVECGGSSNQDARSKNKTRETEGADKPLFWIFLKYQVCCTDSLSPLTWALTWGWSLGAGIWGCSSPKITAKAIIPPRRGGVPDPSVRETRQTQPREGATHRNKTLQNLWGTWPEDGW